MGQPTFWCKHPEQRLSCPAVSGVDARPSAEMKTSGSAQVDRTIRSWAILHISR